MELGSSFPQCRLCGKPVEKVVSRPQLDGSILYEAHCHGAVEKTALRLKDLIEARLIETDEAFVGIDERHRRPLT